METGRLNFCWLATTKNNSFSTSGQVAKKTSSEWAQNSTTIVSMDKSSHLLSAIPRRAGTWWQYLQRVWIQQRDFHYNGPFLAGASYDFCTAFLLWMIHCSDRYLHFQRIMTLNLTFNLNWDICFGGTIVRFRLTCFIFIAKYISTNL